VQDGDVEEKLVFSLREWLKNEDLFDYGMSPQFLSRFDAVVLLEDLTVDQLIKIFLESPESGFRHAREYFERRGFKLSLSPDAVGEIATAASRQPRLGARALKEVFRRVIRDYEFDPGAKVNGPDRAILLDLPEVRAALGS
jgi:ATP-dependent Clp protease ATP-binding subunit ClpX